MNETNKVVAHLLDGTVFKGTTNDFFPGRPSFHLVPAGGGAPHEIRCKHMKALFFVKEFAGLRTRKDVRGFIAAPAETVHGRKVAIRFKDGELVCGYSMTFSNEKEGFFVAPADPGSNNTRIYVITKSAEEIKGGPPAEVMAEKYLKGSRAA